MSQNFIIANDRQARETEALLKEISNVLSSEHELKAIVEGLPREVINGVRRSLSTEKRELSESLSAYLNARDGNFELLRQRAGRDIGNSLIIARVSHGWSQKELGRKLGLREQAIQRYEAERYRSISLSGLLRVARTLGVRLEASVSVKRNSEWLPSYEMSPVEAQKILRHARVNGWLEEDPKETSDENSLALLTRLVAEHVAEHGTPSLLREGLNVKDHGEDWSLLSWKAQVTRRANKIIKLKKPKYRPLDLSWLLDLVRLSTSINGARQAQELLIQHGIVLIIEPHIVGMKVDGAAFLVDGIPVIGMTLLRDTIDNFWFTLLHEIGHVILHYRTGLSSGFYDDIESSQTDEFEEEANQFSSNMLIPEELWLRSPARISKSPEPIEQLALQLSISPAIIFGRIRMERKNYAIFSDKIGRGKIRVQFPSPTVEANNETG